MYLRIKNTIILKLYVFTYKYKCFILNYMYLRIIYFLESILYVITYNILLGQEIVTIVIALKSQPNMYLNPSCV